MYTTQQKRDIRFTKSELDSKVNFAFDNVTNLLEQLYLPNTELLSNTEKKLHIELQEFVKEKRSIIRKEKEYIDNNIEWDKLNIAFFGETNAGKSTLIEALLSSLDMPSDGHTIGDGQKDFTKNVEYHNLTIDGHNLTLIDLPGIEGDENGNLEDIDSILKRGITKAHIIFYVYGEKKPEPATALKIKKYASEQAIVYSVRNKRGKGGMFKRMKKNEGVAKISRDDVNKKAIEIFKDVLGNNYKGDFIVHALSAYLSKGNLKREDFKVDKKGFDKIFTSSNDLKNFSKLPTLEYHILDKLKESEKNIYLANELKLSRLLNSISISLDRYVSDNLSIKYLNSILKEVDDFFKRINSLNDQFKTNSKSEIRTLLLNVFNEIESRMINLIDEGENDKNRFKYIINSQSKIANEGIRKIIKNQNKELSNKIGVEIKRMERLIKLGVNNNSNYIKIDLDNIELEGLEEMDIDFGDVAGLGTAAAGFLAGPVVGGVLLVGFIISKLLGDGGKSEAKSKISDEIAKSRNKAISKTNSLLDKIFMKNKQKLNTELSELKRIPTKMSVWRNNIIKTHKELSNIIKL